jgi:septal ring factor EnvC (AmiA/AmiB activator)
VHQALFEEKTALSAAVKAFTEAKMALKDSDADKAKLSQMLKTTKVGYTATYDNLASKSKELDDAVIQEQEANTPREQAKAKLADVEKRLAAAEDEKKDQGLLLKMAWKVLSKREDSSVLIISTVVANAMSLLKCHLRDLDVKILRKDFTIDEAERKTLTNGTYDAAHKFTSSYDFSSLAEYEDNDSPHNM